MGHDVAHDMGYEAHKGFKALEAALAAHNMGCLKQPVFLMEQQFAAPSG